MQIKIIENFLTKKDFEEINSIILDKVDKNKMRVYHNSIRNNEIIKNDCFGHNLLKQLQYNYHLKAIKILKEINPLKANLYDYSEFHLIETGSNYEFPIHDDTPNKLLSGVIYLRPEKNVGTIFYNNKRGEGKNEIDWKINRAVFFSRSEKNTWHSYKGDGKENRIALVYNLMTNRIRDVYKIEKKSYLLGQLRYKLNPYIHRYFNFTI